MILVLSNTSLQERFSICQIDEWDKNAYIISKKLQVFYLLCILPYSSLLSSSHDEHGSSGLRPVKLCLDQ